MYARDGMNLFFELVILGVTLFKTLGIRGRAKAIGVHMSLTELLVRDGALNTIFQWMFIL